MYASVGAEPVDPLPRDGADRVRRFAHARDASILAHNYQLPEIQDVAYQTAESLGLSRLAGAADSSTIA